MVKPWPAPIRPTNRRAVIADGPQQAGNADAEVLAGWSGRRLTKRSIKNGDARTDPRHGEGSDHMETRPIDGDEVETPEDARGESGEQAECTWDLADCSATPLGKNLKSHAGE